MEVQQEREIRAARNESLFRAVNEKVRELNETLATVTNRFMIACECADATCTETIEILPYEYLAVRASPRRFAVLPGHAYADVESVIHQTDRYLVVEKEGVAAEVAEQSAP